MKLQRREGLVGQAHRLPSVVRVRAAPGMQMIRRRGKRCACPTIFTR